jgi:hypothetical protein
LTRPVKAKIARKNIFDDLNFLEEDSSNCKVFTDIIINDEQQDATVLDLFISSLLYMFRAIPSPIIRST